MRILQVIHNYPPEFRGGTESVVEGLNQALRDLGHDPCVLSGSAVQQPQAQLLAESWMDVPVRRLVCGPGFRDPIDPFRAEFVPLIERVFDELKPDVVHVHHWMNVGGDVVRRAARRGIRSVVTLHDAFSSCGRFFRIPGGTEVCDATQSVRACAPCIASHVSLDEREVGLRVDSRLHGFAAELATACAVFAPSVAHRDLLMPHVPTGVTIDVCALASAGADPIPRPGRRGPLRVLHFGNLCRVKGVELLANAVRRSVASGHPMELVAAGNVIESGMDLEGVTLAGPYDGGRLQALVADADVACFPSFAPESYSLVVDEALDMGIPVVVSDRGAPKERVGSRGLVVRAGDLDAWSSALSHLASDANALGALVRGVPHPRVDRAAFASRMVAAYERARVAPLPSVDLETHLLDRLARREQWIGEILAYIGRLRAESGAGA